MAKETSDLLEWLLVELRDAADKDDLDAMYDELVDNVRTWRATQKSMAELEAA
jgi:hypothetical protein